VPVADPVTLSQRLHDAQLAFLEGVAAEEFYGLFPIVVTAQADACQADASAALLQELTVMVSWEHAAQVDNALAFVDIYSGAATQPVAALIESAAPVASPTTKPLQQSVRAGLAVISAYAHDLAPDLAIEDPAAWTRILAACTAAAEDLAEALQSPPVGMTCPELAPLCEEARAAADNILLLSMEGGLAPTITAVTTLLQMRRALEVHDAA
jgi:hypothetical protein